MGEKPTVAEAQLICQLRDLYREDEMRHAASSFVNRGALSEESFLASGFRGEPFLI